MFKIWKHIEKRFRRRKAQEEEEKKKKDDEDDKCKKDGGDKGKKDDEDYKHKKDGGDKGEKDDGDRQKKGDGDKGKKDDDNMGQKHKKEDKDEDKKRKDRKREEKDDDEITGEELEKQLHMVADREQRRLEMQSIPEDTLDYVEDQDVEDDNDEDQLENKKAFDRYRGNDDDNFDVEGDYNDVANNNGDEEDDNDDDDQVRDDDDDTSATSEEKISGDDRPGERDARKKEEKIPFNFEEEMEMVCKRLAFTHGHEVEEQLRTARIIKAFHKKKEWLNLREQMEDEQRKAMAEKFDEDLRLHFQEEVEKQKLKAAQELHKEEERKLEEVVKQLSAEHGVSEEDIRIQMQLVQDIVKTEVEKKLENERKRKKKRREQRRWSAKEEEKRKKKRRGQRRWSAKENDRNGKIIGMKRSSLLCNRFTTGKEK